MASIEKTIEKSSITIKTAAAVVIGVVSIVASTTGSYIASGAAVEKKLLNLQHAIENEAKDRIHADEKLEMKVAQNADKIKAIELRMDMAGKPGTVTTYR